MSHKDRSADAERLARLLRVSRDAELASATRDAIKALLLAELGQPVVAADRPHSVRAPSGTPEVSTGLRREGAKTKTVPAPSPEQLELKLRQLAQAEASWEELQPLAMELLLRKPGPATTARLAELAFLHATTEELEVFLAHAIREGGDACYREIHPAVRAHLTARLWREGRDETLKTLLFKEKDESYLAPIERLYAFQGMAKGRDAATPYIYYRRYAKELESAARELGAHVGVPLPTFLLTAGRMAANLGHDKEARDILHGIPEEAPERDDALTLLLETTVVKNRAGMSHYVELLVAEASSTERLKLIAGFFAATRGLGGFRDHNRPALNEVLRDPLEWLATDPEVLATLSELLVANRDLEPLLPNLYEHFRQNALRFHGPVVDAALWQGARALKAEAPRDKFWRGVALLHHYVNCGPAAEAALWEARDCVAEAKRSMREPLPFGWKELHKAAVAWVARNHYLMETDRSRMIEQLRVAVDAAAVATADIEDYLKHAAEAPASVLEGLQDLAGAKNAPALEARIILKRSETAHLTNGDLSRLWHLANARKDSDLAWRIATVLTARQALSASVRHAWEISGEKRAHYPLQSPDKTVLELLLKDFPGRTARLAYALVHVGPLLPELLAILDQGASVARLAAARADSIEAKVDKALAAVKWLPAPKRRYRFSQDAAGGATDLPAFAQVLPANAWSTLVARLSERLGLNAFGYRLSGLTAQIEELIPRIAGRQDLRRHSGKVAAWLKALSPEQRAAWQELTSVARGINDADAAHALASLVARLAIIVLPNHLMALTSLMAMRAPAHVIWSVEQFLVSETYSQIRTKLGTANRVPVPHALLRLAEIHCPAGAQ